MLPTSVFLGAPGSGKGTQSARLSAELGIPSLSTGDMLRSEARQDAALRRHLATGSLVSDEMVCGLVGARLRRNPSVILDGFPRTVKQAAWLDGLITRPRVVHTTASGVVG